MNKNNISLFTLIFASLVLAYASLIYYPKWRVGESECVLTWDVSGYYFYLPAFLIYKDAKGLGFKDEILKKYYPTPDLQQAMKHEASGNYVMKYSCGQALMYLPAFCAAHIYAKITRQPADGFSVPYQKAIIGWTLLMAFVGLWFTRKSLLYYFEDRVVAITLLLLVLGTNYLNYASIDSAMTHNWCFTLLSILIFSTIQFYETAMWRHAIAVGICIGWAALTRPTEILIAIVPILWGLYTLDGIKQRLSFFVVHRIKLISAAIIVLLIGGIQLVYWKYATGSWIIYSYGDQTFSWLRPHIKSGMLSYKAGWLPYTPLMIFALIGVLLSFFKQKSLFWVSFIYVSLFIYVAFAWDIWWYGGSLGQRTMVQSYALQVFPMAVFIQFLVDFYKKNLINKLLSGVVVGLILLFVYVNIWFTHQAHKGGFFQTEFMNKKYYWATVGRLGLTKDYLKLLDSDELHIGIPKELTTIYNNDFNADTLAVVDGSNAQNKLLYLDHWVHQSKEYSVSMSKNGATWLRVSTGFRVTQKEWNPYDMLQMTVAFTDNEKVIKERKLLVHRYLNDNERETLYLDVKIPEEKFDKVSVRYSNAESNRTTFFDDLRIESFNE